MPASLQPVFLRLRNVLDRMTGKEVALKGGMSTPGVVRVGDTVRRPVKERSAFVHDVLRHLELREFDRAPRFLGIDEKGRAMLTYISGTVPRQVGGFQKEQCFAAARLLRLFHDATVDCDLKGEYEVVCHGDPAPGNYVLRDGMPFALIDFDGAHPGRREEDVGYAAWMWLHIGNRKVAPEEQGSNLVDFVSAYDAAATWNPLEAVLQAQYATVARIPNSFKWANIKAWAQACLAWTYRNREGIAAGIAMRSEVLSCPEVSETLNNTLQATCEDARA
jgi:Phosphotransferase enzyme family